MLYFVLLCGGKGTRMNSPIPKQYLKINNQYMFMYSVFALNKIEINKKLLIVADEEYKNLISSEVDKFKLDYFIVNPGETREDSVNNALNAITDINNDDIVLIHDSGRMLISTELINNIINELKQNDSAIPYKPMNSAIYDSNISEYINTSELKIIETPQGFNLKLLKDAFKNAKNLSIYKDDGSIFLNMHKKLNFIYNKEYNLKVTTEDDLKQIEVFSNVCK